MHWVISIHWLLSYLVDRWSQGSKDTYCRRRASNKCSVWLFGRCTLHVITDELKNNPTMEHGPRCTAVVWAGSSRELICGFATGSCGARILSGWFSILSVQPLRGFTFLHSHGRINVCTLHRPSPFLDLFRLLDNQSTIDHRFFLMLRPRWLKMGIWCCNSRSGKIYCRPKRTLLSSFPYICICNTQPYTTHRIWRIIDKAMWTNCSNFPLPRSSFLSYSLYVLDRTWCRSSSTDWGLCIGWCGRSLLCLASAWGEYAGASRTGNQLKRQKVGRYQGCFWIIGRLVTCLCSDVFVHDTL